MAGFPAVGGPIVFILALERGAEFAAGAAIASLGATLGSLSFNLAYSWSCLRRAWPLSVAAGLAAWFSAALAISLLPRSAWLCLGMALVGLAIMPRLFPHVEAPAGRPPLPPYEVFLRMAAGAALTVLVSLAAPAIGPSWSGLLSVFPTLGVVLSVFSQRAHGAAAAATLLRSMSLGLYSFSAFFFVLALVLPTNGIALSFAAALGVALLVQGATMLVLRWRAPRA